jgi:hypothetical protein
VKNLEKEMVVTRERMSNDLEHDIPQYQLWQVLFMFLWPAVWFSFLIYVVGRGFIPEGGVTPTWVMLAVTVLGTGAELVAGLVMLRREGYSLTFAALRNRIRWQWPKGWQAWLIAMAVPGNFGWRTGIRVRFWAAWEPGASDGLPLDRQLPVPDGFPGNGCTWAWLTQERRD